MTFTETNGAVTFAVKVVPRSSKNLIAGIEDDIVKVRLKAPPVEGKANAALIKFFAETLGVSQAQIEIVRGEIGRRKLVKVRGVTAVQLKRCFEDPAG